MIANVTEFNHPSVRSPAALQSARDVNIPHPGTKLNFDPLTVRVLLDNKMVVYKSIYDWIVNNATKEVSERDLTLTLYNMNENPTGNIKYLNAFPTDLGPISFSSTDQNDTTLFSDVTFSYSHFIF